MELHLLAKAATERQSPGGVAAFAKNVDHLPPGFIGAMELHLLAKAATERQSPGGVAAFAKKVDHLPRVSSVR